MDMVEYKVVQTELGEDMTINVPESSIFIGSGRDNMNKKIVVVFLLPIKDWVELSAAQSLAKEGDKINGSNIPTIPI